MTVHQFLDSSLHGFQTGPTRKKPKEDLKKKIESRARCASSCFIHKMPVGS